MPVVQTEHLKAYYVTKVYGVERTIQAVDDVSLDIYEDEILGIAGESGCGKSTLMKVLFGMVKPPLTIMGGSVRYRSGETEVDISSLDPEALKSIRWRDISYVPQGSMSVLNPVRKIRKTFQDFMGAHMKLSGRKEFAQVVGDHLCTLGLPVDVLNAYPHQLSGGMQQRVTIALATILHPRVIFGDEPTTALDVVVQRGVIQLLKNIQKQYHNTVVMVTHDMAVHANLTDRVAIMYAGQIVEVGKTRDIFKNPQHCYSKYLIGSLPKIGDKAYRVSAPGDPPVLSDPPPGCRFLDRCPDHLPRCSEETPQLCEVEEGHTVACFRVFE